MKKKRRKEEEDVKSRKRQIERRGSKEAEEV